MLKSDINFYLELLDKIRKYCSENDYLVVPTLYAIGNWFLVMGTLLEEVDAIEDEEEA